MTGFKVNSDYNPIEMEKPNELLEPKRKTLEQQVFLT
jgi:hypothetical protein